VPASVGYSACCERVWGQRHWGPQLEPGTLYCVPGLFVILARPSGSSVPSQRVASRMTGSVTPHSQEYSRISSTRRTLLGDDSVCGGRSGNGERRSSARGRRVVGSRRFRGLVCPTHWRIHVHNRVADCHPRPAAALWWRWLLVARARALSAPPVLSWPSSGARLRPASRRIDSGHRGRATARGGCGNAIPGSTAS
jgi:hypothetical protein